MRIRGLAAVWALVLFIAVIQVFAAPVSYAAPSVNEAFPNCPQGADNCGAYSCNGLFANEANQTQKDYCASQGITLTEGDAPPPIETGPPSDGLQHGCEDWTEEDYNNTNQFHNQTDLDGCKYVRDNILPFVPNDNYFVPIPRDNGTDAQSETANKFCEYYQIPDSENFRLSRAYNQFEVAKMCRLGYEVGFGKNKICSNDYLRRFKVDFGSSEEDISYQRDRFRQLEAIRVSACRDGYTQYTVDYWACNGNEGCQKKLRLHPANVFNPGDPPKRNTGTGSTVNPTKAIPGLVTLNNAGNDKKCGSVYTAYFVCTLSNDPENTGLWQTLQTIINILLTLVTIFAVGGLAYGGMRYAASRDDPGELGEAKKFIRNVVIGLVIFILMWAIIEYVIPGGIIS